MKTHLLVKNSTLELEQTDDNVSGDEDRYPFYKKSPKKITYYSRSSGPSDNAEDISTSSEQLCENVEENKSEDNSFIRLRE